MEPLRIRIPNVDYCSKDDCFRLTRNFVCKHCIFKTFSDPRVRQEVSPATFRRETNLVHSTPLGRFFRG